MAYDSGVLSLVRTRLRHGLTVLMLHRVIDLADPDFEHADPTYTLALGLFEQLLDFVRDHYTVVSLRDVADAHEGIAPLPQHALLITFDDGWADNLHYAAPPLYSRRLPAVIFAVAEPILSDSAVWWQERVFAAGRAGLLSGWSRQPSVQDVLADLHQREGGPQAIDIVSRLARVDEPTREAVLVTLPPAHCRTRMMLEPRDLAALVADGIDIGVHGYSHAPLTTVTDVASELSRARDAIAAASGGTATTEALGCPHGCYDDNVIAGAKSAGIKVVFTSDAHVNRTNGGMLTGRQTLGRINVVGKQISTGPTRLDPGATARWLWARECR